MHDEWKNSNEIPWTAWLKLHPLGIQTLLLCICFSNTVLSQQCYTQPNCVEDVVSGPTTAEECCVGTDDGMSFGVSGRMCTVSQCIGNYGYTYRNISDSGQDMYQGQRYHVKSGGRGLGVHEVHYIQILHSSFDPLTTKFWGGSALPYQKVGGGSSPPCPPGSLPLSEAETACQK